MFAIGTLKPYYRTVAYLCVPLATVGIISIWNCLKEEPNCSHCKSSQAVYCSKANRDPNITDIRNGGVVQEWTCESCHQSWNRILAVNLHRQRGYGCTQVVYY